MADKHDYHWTFGNQCHIEFPNGGAPVDAGVQPFYTEEGCATISDSATGALLLHTDGRKLYKGANAIVPLSPATAIIGGGIESTHSALIIPPAGGGSRYHIFGVSPWHPAGTVGKPVTYTAVTITGGVANPVAGPLPLTAIGPQATGVHQGAAERLAAISHDKCDKYWVIAQSVDGGHGRLHAMLVDSDAMPTFEVVTPYPYSPATHQYCVKFSPDGKLFAVANLGTAVGPRIDILRFDRATGQFGAHSQVTGFTGNNRPYGVEFSPNSQYLYFTDQLTAQVRRHTIGASANFSTAPVVSQWLAGQPSTRVGALQLGPNGKIYGVLAISNTLFEIGAPDSGTATAAGVQFNAAALTTTGQVVFGLPTFLRIADACRKEPPEEDRCAELAAEVDKILGGRKLYNSMLTCKGEKPKEPACEPLEIPPIAPQTYIRWGDSKCDCIEGDDTEVMHLTICNPYKNVTLSNLIVQQLIVVDANGNPVPNLPDGSPSIQLVPIGPYCFDDLAPCTCVTREFVLRLRGAPGGPYQIRVRGICFDACFHGDGDACFQFDVCKD